MFFVSFQRMMYPSQFDGDDFIISFAIISAECLVFGSNPGLCFMEIFLTVLQIPFQKVFTVDPKNRPPSHTLSGLGFGGNY